MPTAIRDATAADVPFLARIMLAASRSHLPHGVWDLLIGGDDSACLDYLARLAVAEPRSLCHYQAFRIVEVEGQPAAALSTFRFADGGWRLVAEAMQRVQRDLGWTESDTAASHRRVAPVWSCFLPEIGADCAIENVAALPDFRRRGLTTALLADAVAALERRGCRLIQITTYIDNHAAIAAYQSAGFRVSDEKRCPEIEAALGTPGFLRLTRAVTR